jgi:hypothetical protein
MRDAITHAPTRANRGEVVKLPIRAGHGSVLLRSVISVVARTCRLLQLLFGHDR